LLASPFKADKHTLDFDAPLSKWVNFGSYDKAKECADDRAEQLNFWTSHKTKNSLDKALTLKLLAVSVCIATDDPRLKGN
jgi:hypothetical protein